MEWLEGRGLLDNEQQGFRKGRATMDATQMMWMLQEDMADLKRRTEGVLNDEDVVAARLLDLQKAYPWVNRPALWRLL